MSENNHMWTALIIFGGIYAYNTLKKDAGDIVDTVSDAVNITKDTNVAYKGVNYVVGEDNFRTATDWFFDKFNPKIKAEREAMERMLKGETTAPTPTPPTTAKNHRGARVNAPIEASTPKLSTAKNHRGAADSSPQSKFKNSQKTGITDTSPNIIAKNFNGQWKKLINGQWLQLTKSDKVVTIRGVNVVKPYLWKP